MNEDIVNKNLKDLNIARALMSIGLYYTDKIPEKKELLTLLKEGSRFFHRWHNDCKGDLIWKILPNLDALGGEFSYCYTNPKGFVEYFTQRQDHDFEGQLLGQALHKEGTNNWMKFKNGDKFEGKFKDGLIREGTLIHTSGIVYKGLFSHRMKYYYGIETYPDGSSY